MTNTKRQLIPTVKDEETISDRTYNSSQSWFRELVVVRGGRRLRFEVRRNAYEEQSYAEAEVWANDKWQSVHRIPGVDLMCKSVSYVQRDARPSAFDADIAELRRVAVAVLSLNTKET